MKTEDLKNRDVLLKILNTVHSNADFSKEGSIVIVGDIIKEIGNIVDISQSFTTEEDILYAEYQLVFDTCYFNEVSSAVLKLKQEDWVREVKTKMDDNTIYISIVAK